MGGIHNLLVDGGDGLLYPAGNVGELAEKIIEQAKQADVPVHKDDKLAGTLSKLQIGDMIPPELYEVVAEILMFVDSMDKIKAKVSAYQNSKKV